MNAAPQNRSRIIVAFALLYVLWGSTYLAMRVIVRDMPPYVAGTVRYLVAGPIMLAACALMGRKISLTRLDLRRLLVISILLLVHRQYWGAVGRSICFQRAGVFDRRVGANLGSDA